MEKREVAVETQILNRNETMADDITCWLAAHGVEAVNIMASPGAGKTSIILQTIAALRGRREIAVIEGDLASSLDADRVAAAGVLAIQINTGGGCHLEAPMVRRALEQLPLDQIDMVLIENVGNLVCPIAFRLGEKRRALIASVPEGDDKPLKYPTSFLDVNAVVLNKIDLLPYIDFDLEAFKQRVRGLNPNAPIFLVSCKTGEGIDDWANWLAGE
mgnify:CR=1 FL=1